LLSILLESHVTGDLAEALPTEEDVVLADEPLLAAASTTLMAVVRAGRGVLSGHVASVLGS
jgi:hypothetical protein